MGPSVLVLKNDLSSQMDQALNFILLTPWHQQILLFAPTLLVLGLAGWSYWRSFLRGTKTSEWSNNRVHRGKSYQKEGSAESVPLICLISMEDGFFDLIGHELKHYGLPYECFSNVEEALEKGKSSSGGELLILDLDHTPNRSYLNSIAKWNHKKAPLLLLGELEKNHYFPVEVLAGDLFIKKVNVKDQFVRSCRGFFSKTPSSKKAA